MAETIQVQVSYATPDKQVVIDLNVIVGTSLQQAIVQSGLLRDFPEIDLAAGRFGIYGKLKKPDTILRDHDRVEIYRPLIADAQEARRSRAARK